MAKFGVSDRAINHNHQSSVKAGGMCRNLIRWWIVYKTIQSQSLIYGVITTEVKTDENASEASYQDPTDIVSSITSKARDMTKSRWSISNPTATT